MVHSEIEIERLAQAMVERHGTAAAKAAVARLNQMIDRGDGDGTERWACVVRTIHEWQGVGPVFSPANRSAETARLAPAHS